MPLPRRYRGLARRRCRSTGRRPRSGRSCCRFPRAFARWSERYCRHYRRSGSGHRWPARFFATGPRPARGSRRWLRARDWPRPCGWRFPLGAPGPACAVRSGRGAAVPPPGRSRPAPWPGCRCRRGLQVAAVDRCDASDQEAQGPQRPKNDCGEQHGGTDQPGQSGDGDAAQQGQSPDLVQQIAIPEQGEVPGRLAVAERRGAQHEGGPSVRQAVWRCGVLAGPEALERLLAVIGGQG